MEFIVNDCSLHGQFSSPAAFHASLRAMLVLRDRIEQARRLVRCPRSLLDAPISPGQTLRDVLKSMPDRALRGIVVAWLANKGPFWDDERLHGPDEWFEVQGRIVTDSGLAEAAKAVLQNQQRAVLSFQPSQWTYTPVQVVHVRDASNQQAIPVENHWDMATVVQRIRNLRAPLVSWQDLVVWARDECPRLTLTPDVIQGLDGHPFIPGAAERFQVLLTTLDTIRGSFGPDGQLSAEGMRIYQNHFTGEKAWFTDSSNDEKVRFREELTFRDPEQPGSTILCPWHGKVKIEQMRMHFSFPIRHDRPLFVFYIGPKLTKR